LKKTQTGKGVGIAMQKPAKTQDNRPQQPPPLFISQKTKMGPLIKKKEKKAATEARLLKLKKNRGGRRGPGDPKEDKCLLPVGGRTSKEPRREKGSPGPAKVIQA